MRWLPFFFLSLYNLSAFSACPDINPAIDLKKDVPQFVKYPDGWEILSSIPWNYNSFPKLRLTGVKLTDLKPGKTVPFDRKGNFTLTIAPLRIRIHPENRHLDHLSTTQVSFNLDADLSFGMPESLAKIEARDMEGEITSSKNGEFWVRSTYMAPDHKSTLAIQLVGSKIQSIEIGQEEKKYCVESWGNWELPDLKPDQIRIRRNVLLAAQSQTSIAGKNLLAITKRTTLGEMDRVYANQFSKISIRHVRNVAGGPSGDDTVKYEVWVRFVDSSVITLGYSLDGPQNRALELAGGGRFDDYEWYTYPLNHGHISPALLAPLGQIRLTRNEGAGPETPVEEELITRGDEVDYVGIRNGKMYYSEKQVD